jgi:hypothetical protein
MAKSRMNGLGISPKAGDLYPTLGNLGAKITPLKASNNPGPMTAPSSQGPVQPGAKQATGVTPKV